MPSFEQGQVVRVPFPYTDKNTTQRRPALVVSHGGVGGNGDLLWVVMITSAENRPWPLDVSLGSTWEEAGLTAPSVIRPEKIAVIEASAVLGIAGQIKPTTMVRVSDAIREVMGFRRVQ